VTDKAEKASVKRGGAGRKRRVTGWTLIALGLLVAGVWWASGWWGFGYGAVAIDRGRVGVSYTCINHEFGFDHAHYKRFAEERENAWFLYEQQWSGQRCIWTAECHPGHHRCPLESCNLVFVSRSVTLGDFDTSVEWVAPLWPIPLLFWAAGVPILRSGIVARRRAMAGNCAKCGYSLAGLGDGAACPECGKAGAVPT